MPSIFAMSDTHGCDEILEETIERIGFPRKKGDKLILLGDYVSHDWEDAISDLAAIMDIQARYPEGQVICLPGNHEIDWCENYGQTSYGRAFARWINRLPLYYETDDQIFVHAGIDEEAGDLWRIGTPDDWFTHAFPPITGAWDDGSGEGARSKDIVAGHVGTSSEYLGGREYWGRVFYDGESHFYLDGTTESSGVIPVLEYDIEHGIYYAWDKDGDRYEIAKR